MSSWRWALTRLHPNSLADAALRLRSDAHFVPSGPLRCPSRFFKTLGVDSALEFLHSAPFAENRDAYSESDDELPDNSFTELYSAF